MPSTPSVAVRSSSWRLQLLVQHGADRDHRLAPQLDVEIAQVRVPVGADLKRVPRECHDARDPQPGERQQQDDRAVLLGGQQRQIGGIDQLIEHRRLDPARELLLG